MPHADAESSSSTGKALPSLPGDREERRQRSPGSGAAPAAPPGPGRAGLGERSPAKAAGEPGQRAGAELGMLPPWATGKVWLPQPPWQKLQALSVAGKG